MSEFSREEGSAVSESVEGSGGQPGEPRRHWHARMGTPEGYSVSGRFQEPGAPKARSKTRRGVLGPADSLPFPHRLSLRALQVIWPWHFMLQLESSIFLTETRATLWLTFCFWIENDALRVFPNSSDDNSKSSYPRCRTGTTAGVVEVGHWTYRLVGARRLERLEPFQVPPFSALCRQVARGATALWI